MEGKEGKEEGAAGEVSMPEMSRSWMVFLFLRARTSYLLGINRTYYRETFKKATFRSIKYKAIFFSQIDDNNDNDSGIEPLG